MRYHIFTRSLHCVCEFLKVKSKSYSSEPWMNKRDELTLASSHRLKFPSLMKTPKSQFALLTTCFKIALP